jgi:hypothetical protein
VSVAVQFPTPVLMARFLAQREVIIPEPPEPMFSAEHLVVSFGSVHVLSMSRACAGSSIEVESLQKTLSDALQPG